MSSQSRRLLAGIAGVLFALSFVRLVASMVLRARGENPADYFADAQTSIGSVLVLGIMCFLLRRDLRALLTRPAK